MAGVVWRACLLAILLAGYPHASLPCPVIGKITKNNWAEDQQGHITSTQNAPGITAVAWASYNTTSDYIDASPYVSVTYNVTSQTVDFFALPTLAGVRDYPQMGYPTLAELGGTVQMICGNDTGTFDFSLVVKDTNTAPPTLDNTSYSVEVYETYPAGLVIPGLVISASDFDAEASNNEVSFSLKGDSAFSLTEQSVKTSDTPPTYTTQLKLEQSLVNENYTNYQLTVTAQDPGGLTSTANITVTVIDVDTEQPAFTQDFYTAAVDDPETPGPLDVVIPVQAFDPDSPGKLIYELLFDSAQGNYAEYFSLDPTTAQLNLTKNITSMLQDSATTIPFLLQATEDGGSRFTCRAQLLVTLPSGLPPGCPAIGPVTIGGWPEDKTGVIVSYDAPSVTHAVWSPYSGSGQYLDASDYVSVSVDAERQKLVFSALPDMYGIVDYGSQTFPNPAVMRGTCLLVCGEDASEVPFTLLATDSNTAAPAFSSDLYSVHVAETLPIGVIVGSLVISASDADASEANHEVSFSLQAGSPFSLTPPVKTSDLLPTYTTQLRLEQPLNAANNSSYQLTVTAQDRGGNQTSAAIEVHVIAMDTEHGIDCLAL